MAGILANATSRTMLAAESAADKAVSGYLIREQIVLSVNPTGAVYSWGLSIPQGSTADRSGLSDETAAAPTLTPDVGGEYVAVCTVDGTTFYVLRISVTSSAVATTQEALRLQVKGEAGVAAPPTGSALFHSNEKAHLAAKDVAGVSRYIATYRRATATWDPGSVADGAMTSTTIAVTGAVVGDRVTAGFSNAVPAGAILTASVTGADVVSVTLLNKTGAPLDLASGTLTVDVSQ